MTTAKKKRAPNSKKRSDALPEEEKRARARARRDRWKRENRLAYLAGKAAYYAANKGKARAYVSRNREYIRQWKREWNARNSKRLAPIKRERARLYAPRLAKRRRAAEDKIRPTIKAWEQRNAEKMRAVKSEWAKRNRHKRNAHLKVWRALKAGTLTRKPCEKCGNPKVQAHHRDYSKPLEVRWLCSKHHREHHRKYP